MNSIRSLCLVSGLSVLLAATAFAAETDAGYVDVGQFLPASNGKFVEVNLSSGLLRFAAKLACRHDPETAALIGNLKSIRVNVVGMDDSNRPATVAKIEAARRLLEAKGWTQIVTVQDNEEGDNVNVHILKHNDDAIDGLVVTVIDHKGEAVFVNIVGNITAEQLGEVADKFDIDPLKRVHVKLETKPAGKDA
jgi:hypothetical protein